MLERLPGYNLSIPIQQYPSVPPPTVVPTAAIIANLVENVTESLRQNSPEMKLKRQAELAQARNVLRRIPLQEKMEDQFFTDAADKQNFLSKQVYSPNSGVGITLEPIDPAFKAAGGLAPAGSANEEAPLPEPDLPELRAETPTTAPAADALKSIPLTADQANQTTPAPVIPKAPLGYRITGQVGPNKWMAVNRQGDEKIVEVAPSKEAKALETLEEAAARKGVLRKNFPNDAEYLQAAQASLSGERGGGKLTVDQRRELVSLSKSGPTLDSIGAKYEQLHQRGRAGFLGGWAQEGLSIFSQEDPEYSKADAVIKANLFAFARTLQGAGVLTEQDIKRMEAISPTLRQNREQFFARLDAAKEIMRTSLQGWKVANAKQIDPELQENLDNIESQLSTNSSAAATSAAKVTAPAKAAAPDTSQLYRMATEALAKNPNDPKAKAVLERLKQLGQVPPG